MKLDTDYGRPVRKSTSLHGRKSTPKFIGKAEAYFVFHIGPNFQISLISCLCLHWLSVVCETRYEIVSFAASEIKKKHCCRWTDHISETVHFRKKLLGFPQTFLYKKWRPKTFSSKKWSLLLSDKKVNKFDRSSCR